MSIKASSLKSLGLLVLLGCSSSFFSSSAFANESDNSDAIQAPNWRLLDISYATERDRDSDAKADLLNLRASLPVMEYGLMAVELNTGTISNGFGVSDVNATQINVLGGLRMAASDRADLFVLAGAMRIEIDADSYKATSDGLIAQAGMRGKLTEKIDLSSYLQYSKIANSNTTSWHGDVRYKLFDRVDLYIGAGVYSRAVNGKIGVTLHF